MLNKFKTSFGSFINKLTDRLTSPCERLEYLKVKKEEELLQVMSAVTDLAGKIKELEKAQRTTLRSIDAAKNAAYVAVKDGSEDQARKIFERKVSLETTYNSTQILIDDTIKRLEQLKINASEFEAYINDIKAKISQLETENKIADVKLQIAESTAGLNMDSFEINRNLKEGREQVDAHNARVEAITELDSQGVYNGIKGIDNVDAQIDSLNSKSKIDAEFEALKRQINEENEVTVNQ
ncbi:MAG: PspA/IM30 family protein [Methanogenium sp.]|jgi:phage shock protein A